MKAFADEGWLRGSRPLTQLGAGRPDCGKPRSMGEACPGFSHRAVRLSPPLPAISRLSPSGLSGWASRSERTATPAWGPQEARLASPGTSIANRPSRPLHSVNMPGRPRAHSHASTGLPWSHSMGSSTWTYRKSPGYKVRAGGRLSSGGVGLGSGLGFRAVACVTCGYVPGSHSADSSPGPPSGSARA